ncbi:MULTISPECIES: APC family permease [Arthrobacter]|uniref:APC family permease n=2 Tax=Arthrobacter TaxID=1663 RepID=A0ABU9KHL1_9MICC|nr:APC family permease [Arthrobacter sp. YJM1]MDP5226610.1 APC family permease [Arthrobacter sp. YJM1]
MTPTPTEPGTQALGADTRPRQLRRVLGLSALVMFGLSYMAPVTVFTTFGTVTQITDGHLAAAYVVALVTMFFTALSYARISGVIPAAGSAYSYTTQTFGGHLGFVTGWTLMLDYLFLPMINFLLVGLYMNSAFPAIPAWVFALVSIVLVLAFIAMGVKFVGKFSGVIVAMAVVIIVVFIALAANYVTGHPAPNVMAPFEFGSGGVSPIFAGAAVLALSFLGFDAVSTLSEDARDAQRNIPRAIVITTILGGVIFIAVAWAGGLVFPDWHAFQSLDTSGIELIERVGGPVLSAIFIAVFVAGCIGSAMTSQVSVSRIIYAMGRDGLLPRPFGKLHPRFGTPVVAAVTVSVVSLLALVLTLDIAATMISFGALFAFSMVNLSVVKHFIWDQKKRGAGAWFNYLVLPLVGFGLTIWLWTSLAATSFTVGICWMAVGVIFLAVRTKGFRKAPPKLSFD